ncbi:hypothetical protein AVEN_61088-1 [Araneus ventricosus]|uniref:Uncharacterized protein n=1 Tax=Araneus ventricosus TaxID=182803 RepID=A0A4Y2M911_ARAVE|nr:hypothetical protein AVEN_61088-1 [Araneus ventricosus]
MCKFHVTTLHRLGGILVTYRQTHVFSVLHCYEHEKLPSNVNLMVVKIVLQGYVWECRENEAIDSTSNLGVKFGHHFGDMSTILETILAVWHKFGDEMWDLKSTGNFLISLLEAEIRIYPDDSV